MYLCIALNVFIAIVIIYEVGTRVDDGYSPMSKLGRRLLRKSMLPKTLELGHVKLLTEYGSHFCNIEKRIISHWRTNNYYG